MSSLKIKLGFSNGLSVGKIGFPSAGESTYYIQGTVYDADGATAVEGATITLGAYSTTSAANGTYSLTGIPPGTSGSMTCTKAGYSWTAITVAAMSGNLTSQNYTNAWYAAGGSLASCVAAYKSTGAALAAAAKVNIVNPGTLDLIDGVNAPSWNTATGWLFNSGDVNSQYLRTGITTANGDVTFFIAFTVNVTGGTNTMFGVYAAGNLLIQRSLPTDRAYHNGASPITIVGGAITTGTHTLAIAGGKAYIDGVEETGTMGKNAITQEIYLGALNIVGTGARQACGSYITHFGYWNTVLDATKMAILDAAAP